MSLVRKLYNSTLWSCAGLKYAFQADRSFRLEVYLAFLLIPLSFYLAANKLEFILLVVSVLLVLLAELINTAIETVVDRISTQQHLLSKHAKDLGSAVVFCALLILVSVWVIICIF